MNIMDCKKTSSRLLAFGLLSLSLSLPACVTQASMEARSEAQVAADAAKEVDSMIKDAEAETTEEEIKDYTVADTQGFDPAGIVVHFEFEKATLTAETVQALDKIVKGMKKDPLSNITISAHADKQGGEAYNEVLSARRAKVIKDYLLAHGIEEDRLNPVHLGATAPLDESNTVVAYKKNRRGEFNINYGPSVFGQVK